MTKEYLERQFINFYNKTKTSDKKEKKCIISIIDDDGTNRTDDRYTGIYSFLQEKGIPMGFAVPTDAPSKSSGTYTIEQLTQFVQNGNEVLMHGLSAADDNAKTQTLEEFKTSIDGSVDWARANGFTDNIYVYPRGMQPQDTLNFIEKIQYMISKDIIAGYNVNTPVESSEVEGYEAWYSYANGNAYNGVTNRIPFVETPADFSKEMLLNRMECKRSTMTQNWWVNRLHQYIEDKTYIVLFFHSFTSEYSTEGSDGKTSADLFKELITSLVDTYGTQIEWLTPSDALKEIGKLPMTQADVRNMIISSKGNAETMTKEEMLAILNGEEDNE